MIRTHVQLRPTQYERVRELAHQQRISISEAVRRLVDRGLGAGEDGDAQRGAGALLQIAGIGTSGLRDLGRRHDDYLAEDFDD